LADRRPAIRTLVPLAIGCAWAAAFYSADWLRLALFPPHVPRGASLLAVIRPHLEAVALHPWTLGDVAIALPFVALLAALSVYLGLSASRLLRDAERTPPTASAPRARVVRPAPLPH